MKKILTRDEQIELMKAAEKRHNELFARVLKDPLVKQVVASPAPQKILSAYTRAERVLRCG